MKVKLTFINSVVFALSTDAFVRYFEALVNHSFYFVADGVLGDLEEVYQVSALNLSYSSSQITSLL